MHIPKPSKFWLLLLLSGLLTTGTCAADEPATLVPKKIEVGSWQIDDTWKSWGGVGSLEGAMAQRERITAMVPNGNDLWIGTSHGRLLTYSDDDWTLQGTLKRLQITGIAVDGADRVWLSTSDGIRRLGRIEDESWKVTKFLTYYEGHPVFVSGGYFPGEDAVRRWGYVDDIYIPLREKSYSPFVVSSEHGLFCWGGYGRVWHHYMPHYTGANSAWLDTRELVPHRRPTCMVEDDQGHLWIGTEWDGIVRLNAHGRKHSERPSRNNTRDETEFSFYTSKEVGFNFDKVSDFAVSQGQGVWAVVSSRESGDRVAHFNGTKWSTLGLDKQDSIFCVLETEPGEVLVGAGGDSLNHGMNKVNWQSQRVEPVVGMNDRFRDIVKLKDGRIFATSWWVLYEASKP